MNYKSCYIYPSEDIEITKILETKVFHVIKKLIKEDNVKTFYFSSLSNFDTLVYNTLEYLKRFYPNLERVYVEPKYKFNKLDLPTNSDNNFDSLIKSLNLKYFQSQHDFDYKASIINKSEFIILCELPLKECKTDPAYLYAKSKKDCIILYLI